MIEMKNYDCKNEEGEIHYGMMGTKTEQGMVACHGHLLLPEEEYVFNVY